MLTQLPEAILKSRFLNKHNLPRPSRAYIVCSLYKEAHIVRDPLKKSHALTSKIAWIYSSQDISQTIQAQLSERKMVKAAAQTSCTNITGATGWRTAHHHTCASRPSPPRCLPPHQKNPTPSNVSPATASTTGTAINRSRRWCMYATQTNTHMGCACRRWCYTDEHTYGNAS